MKKTLFLAFISNLLISGFAKGQKLERDSLGLNKKEIYILGTFHFREHDFKKYPQDINKEIRKVINLNPILFVLNGWINLKNLMYII